MATKDGIHVATVGYAAKVVVPDAPDVAALHEEYVASGGRFLRVPRVRHDARAAGRGVGTAEVKGAPSVYEFAEGGALTFSY